MRLDVDDHEHQAVIFLEPHLVDAERAQPFGARALHELQVVRVVHDAAGVGVLPVHAHRPDEGSRIQRHHSPRNSSSVGGRALRHFQAEMLIGGARRDAAARSAHDEALLDQERLDHVLDRAALLAERRREALDADRAAVELLDDRQQELAIHDVEAERIDVEHVERRLRHVVGDAPAGLHFRIVAHAP